MKFFLIILAVFAVIIIAILSLSATFTIVYDKTWQTKISILFFEKDIVLSKILSFILFPEKKAKEVSDKDKKKKADKKAKKESTPVDNETDAQPTEISENEQPQQDTEASQAAPAPQKENPIKKLWDNEGIVGILSLVSNVLETANSAVSTLIRGLHIHSLYVMIIVGGGDADMIARSYGTLCKYYYPVKGLILSSMKVDNYDDYIQPDFIADRTECEFQLIVSLSVGLLLKVGLKAVFVFLKNLIINKKGDK